MAPEKKSVIKEFKVKIKSKKKVCQNTILLEIEKPQGFNFKAGQFVMMELVNLAKNVVGGNARAMSIASSPHYENLQIVFREGDSKFKDTAEALKVGNEIIIKGPYGAFILPKEIPQEIVFLAGGVGVTPARSIILEILNEKSPAKIFLFYSNLRPVTSAFLEEFQEIQNSNFQFISTMTELGGQKWQGERGFINGEMLKKYIPDINKPIYFVVGPPSFVGAMQKILVDLGVRRGNIKTEKF